MGVGKSALFDAFGFLADALKFGVEEACDARGRGGFERLRTQGQTDPIEFEVYYREHPKAKPITYEVAIQADESGRPYVISELMQESKDNNLPLHFLILVGGRAAAWRGSQTGNETAEGVDIFKLAKEGVNVLELIKSGKGSRKPEESTDLEIIELEDRRKLGITTLGALKQHPRIVAFRRFIEGWYLSYFTPDATRSLPLAGPQRHLNVHGDNLGNVVQFMEREHPKRFQSILKDIAERIPGIDKIATERTADGRLLLKFNDKGFQDPFYAQQMSDGTLKVFAYLLLLNDPTPLRFCVSKNRKTACITSSWKHWPMNSVNTRASKEVAHRFLITTHQPYFVNALDPKEVWILEKGTDGFSTIRRASEDTLVNNMVAEGLPLGGLWYSDYLDAR